MRDGEEIVGVGTRKTRKPGRGRVERFECESGGEGVGRVEERGESERGKFAGEVGEERGGRGVDG